MAERPLDHDWRKRKQRRARRKRQQIVQEQPQHQRRGHALQNKGGQLIQPEPLELCWQHWGQQLKQHRHPGQRIGKGDVYARPRRVGQGIGLGQRELPAAVAEPQPPGVMLVDVGLVVAVPDPGIVGGVQRRGAIQTQKRRQSQQGPQQQQDPGFLFFLQCLHRCSHLLLQLLDAFHKVFLLFERQFQQQ